MPSRKYDIRARFVEVRSCGASLSLWLFAEVSISAITCVETKRKVPAEKSNAMPAGSKNRTEDNYQYGCRSIACPRIDSLQNSNLPRMLPAKMPSTLPSSSAPSFRLSLQLIRVMSFKRAQVTIAPTGVASENHSNAFRICDLYACIDADGA